MMIMEQFYWISTVDSLRTILFILGGTCECLSVVITIVLVSIIVANDGKNYYRNITKLAVVLAIIGIIFLIGASFIPSKEDLIDVYKQLL